MRIFFTIIDEWHGQRRDLWVEGAPEMPVGSLSSALEGKGGANGHGGGDPIQPWWEGDRLLDPDRPLGLEVHDGAVLGRRPAHDPGQVRPEPTPVGELRAVAGPHAGSRWRFPPGSYLIGRSDEAAVKLVADPRVSRRHALLCVEPGGVTIRDEGSAHGLRRNGGLVLEARLEPGEPVQLGDSVLSWETGADGTAAVVPDGEGGVLFNRPPRLLGGSDPVTVRFPGPAPARPAVNFPLLASLAPVLLGVLLAVVFHQPQFLLFTLLSPIIAVSNFVSQRRGGARTHRERSGSYRQAVARAEGELAAAVRHETAWRRRSFPDPAALAAIAAGPLPPLWERRRADRDFLALRVGLADLPAEVTVQGHSGQEHPGSALAEEQHPYLRQVPAVVDLAADGVLGVAGPRQAGEALARALVVQAAVLHAPDDLGITILTGPHQQQAWGWTRWLPHCRDREGRCPARVGSTDAAVARLAAELAGLVDDRLAASRGPGAAPGRASFRGRAHLVVLDGSYRLGAIPAVTKVLCRGPEAGVYCICLDDTERLLPEECQAVALSCPEQPARLTLRTHRRDQPTAVLADLVEAHRAEDVARALAPLRLNRRVEAGAALPTAVRLLDLLDLEPPSGAAISLRWAAAERSTRAVIGARENGPLAVDFAHDGPHGLVAGTTGSGKSELLQTLIASLAAVNRPDHMNFVLIDYKGGSAFKDCSLLPHTVGMVTDLDGHLTERALASLGAELHRREVLLAGVGATDIEGYWRSPQVTRSGAAGLARLLIAIDEFAALAEELPTFVDGLVDLARRGRSLGLHLLLATQRPSGVVSAAIKTNTNLRITMRVTDAADSVDVIDSPLAARISKSVPGRGYVRVGHEELSEFQAARIGGRRARAGAATLSVREVQWTDLGLPLPEPEQPAVADDSTDLSELVRAIRAAHGALGLDAPRSPWLPPLPEHVVLNDGGLTGTEHAAGRAAFGLEDHPAEQARRPAFFDLQRDGHLLVVGDQGSGRSTLLRTLAGSLAAAVSTEDVHFFGIDCGNGALLPLEELPQCGAVVSRRQPDRVDRLLTKLLADITRRQQVLAQGGFATIADQRAGAQLGARLPYLVVFLDRWEGYNAEFEALDNGRLVTSLLHLMREGPGVGLRMLVTGDRTATSVRFSSLADRVLMLRCHDPATYSMAGLNPRHLPDHIPPGRAFDARTGVELQVALLATDPSGPAQAAALRDIARNAAERDARLPEWARPEPVAPLPAYVNLSGLLRAADAAGPASDAVGDAPEPPAAGPASDTVADAAKPPAAGPASDPAGRVTGPPRPRPVAEGGRVAVSPGPNPSGPVALVGVGGDRLLPQQVDFARAGPGFVVAGPPRSGRSNALLVMARTLVRRGCQIVAVTARPSPLAGLRGDAGVAAAIDGRSTAPPELQGLLTSAGEGPLAVLVDDAELLADSPIGEPLTAFLRTARDRSGALILAGTTADLGGFRGFIPEARKARAGVLLCPTSPGDGDVLGARLPRTALFAGPPGRGVLVIEGALQLVQVPFDDTAGGGR